MCCLIRTGTRKINPNFCGILNVGDNSCQLNWTVNTTGNLGVSYLLDVNFSSNESITLNQTEDFVIKIVSPILSITFSDYLFNVSFGCL